MSADFQRAAPKGLQGRACVRGRSFAVATLVSDDAAEAGETPRAARPASFSQGFCPPCKPGISFTTAI
jgi:hypothetical protein